MAICISEKRGTQKKSIKKAELIKDFGINGDAHAGKWHRQVSLLSYETIEEFKSRGADPKRVGQAVRQQFLGCGNHGWKYRVFAILSGSRGTGENESSGGS